MPPVQGVLADLGVSSMQLDTAERGFSFRFAGPLDMRMDSEAATTAAEIVNETAEGELADLLYQLGRRAGLQKNRQGHRACAADSQHRTSGNGCGRGSYFKGKAETASRDKNVSGAADCGESRVGGTRAVS